MHKTRVVVVAHNNPVSLGGHIPSIRSDCTLLWSPDTPGTRNKKRRSSIAKASMVTTRSELWQIRRVLSSRSLSVVISTSRSVIKANFRGARARARLRRDFTFPFLCDARELIVYRSRLTSRPGRLQRALPTFFIKPNESTCWRCIYTCILFSIKEKQPYDILFRNDTVDRNSETMQLSLIISKPCFLRFYRPKVYCI